MMVCRIRKVKNPDTIAAEIMITIFQKSSSLITSIGVVSDFIKRSTAVRELPIKRGAKSEKTRAMIVMRTPKINRTRYLYRYLLRYFNSFINFQDVQRYVNARLEKSKINLQKINRS